MCSLSIHFIQHQYAYWSFVICILYQVQWFNQYQYQIRNTNTQQVAFLQATSGFGEGLAGCGIMQNQNVDQTHSRIRDQRIRERIRMEQLELEWSMEQTTSVQVQVLQLQMLKSGQCTSIRAKDCAYVFFFEDWRAYSAARQISQLVAIWYSGMRYSSTFYLPTVRIILVLR